MPLTRRRLLQALSASTFAISLNPLARAEQLPAQSPALSFPQGVASADPQADSVMLWTRAVPTRGAQAEQRVLLEVSLDAAFEEVVSARALSTSPESDHTLRVHLSGLAPNRWYFYRFRGGEGSVSRTGRTRTAPADDQAQAIRLAFASCQSYEQGYYGAWARMLADDEAAPAGEGIDFVLHLGDFIYERSWPTRVDGSTLSRRIEDFPDGAVNEGRRHAVSLADYRHLYRSYLSDPHLQAARARWPFICTWDDHEFSNDNYQSFSTYGGDNRQESQRKLDANRAWFEYIPAALDELTEQPAHNFRHQTLERDQARQNRQAVDSLRIYRKLQWGRHLDLVITDNRSYRSAPCVPDGLIEALDLPLSPRKLVEITDAGREYNAGEPPATLPYGDGSTANPGREQPPGTCLGAQQRDWFLDTLRNSQATWKLWGNSLPLVPLNLDLSALPFAGLEDSQLGVDAWAGFPSEVDWLSHSLHEHAITGLVSLSGDHHMHGAGTVAWTAHSQDNPAMMVDFTVAGISSTPVFANIAEAARENDPAFQELVYQERDTGLLPVWHMTMLQGSLSSIAYQRTDSLTLANWLGPNEANPGLRYVDTQSNGYGLVSVTADTLTVELVSMGDITAPFDAPPEAHHRARFTLPIWNPEQGPQLQGPEFTGTAPFPFSAG